MSDVTTLPVRGEVFLDARGDDRTLRVNWHPDAGAGGLVVLSIWREGTCVGSFRLRTRDVPLLVDVLARGIGLFPTVPGSADLPGQDYPFAPPNAAGAGNRSA